jgi:phage regulator Rha-like protein
LTGTQLGMLVAEFREMAGRQFPMELVNDFDEKLEDIQKFQHAWDSERPLEEDLQALREQHETAS